MIKHILANRLWAGASPIAHGAILHNVFSPSYFDAARAFADEYEESNDGCTNWVDMVYLFLVGGA